VKYKSSALSGVELFEEIIQKVKGKLTWNKMYYTSLLFVTFLHGEDIQLFMLIFVWRWHAVCSLKFVSIDEGGGTSSGPKHSRLLLRPLCTSCVAFTLKSVSALARIRTLKAGALIISISCNHSESNLIWPPKLGIAIMSFVGLLAVGYPSFPLSFTDRDSWVLTSGPCWTHNWLSTKPSVS
jgi:hypothetical protein